MIDPTDPTTWLLFAGLIWLLVASRTGHSSRGLVVLDPPRGPPPPIPPPTRVGDGHE